MILSTLIMVFTLLVIMYYGSSKVITDGLANNLIYLMAPNYLVFVGMSAFLFGKIGVVVPVRDLMQKKSEFVGCLFASLWSVLGLFAVFGMVGYLAFGRNEKMANGGGMITLALDQSKVLVQGTELIFILSLIPSFALMVYVPVKIWEKGLFGDWPRSFSRTWWKNLGRALAVCFICYLAVATGRTFDKVMALFGGLFGGPTTYIWPAILHLKICNNATFGKKLIDYMLILVGVLSSLLTLYMAFKKLFAS